MKISKNRYLQAFSVVVILLAIGRCVFLDGMVDKKQNELPVTVENNTEEPSCKPSKSDEPTCKPSKFFDENGLPVKHKIRGVSSFRNAFPDQQDVQILASNKWGVSPVQNREEAENRKAELVYVGSNPYFFVEPLNQSIPYLVPRASVLLQDIGRNFFDSLQVKQLPLHKIIVTSLLRTKDDVTSLRRRNGNATENSCHMYGTTFDIAYNRYLEVTERDTVYSKKDTYKDVRFLQVLSEVLNDLRTNQRCYVKHEVKQQCFHITVR